MTSVVGVDIGITWDSAKLELKPDSTSQQVLPSLAVVAAPSGKLKTAHGKSPGKGFVASLAASAPQRLLLVKHAWEENVAV